ncbi:E3 ubiquitin-protein ligase TRIM21-like [Trematomus bernacchii]|uniref:E3 ubiquitin-protein ligase TRIM21-like n=1 Tax=Trematomus bernacchii TaxID=40690 RepID=UPI00146C8210|nr:E3 ubiquitin-protein ligase TRIM21-like [Trematomus bernacchii]
MAFALSEDQFLCSICLDMFRNPVSIPCGHNFCQRCIKRFWDTKHKFECPLCKEDFKTRPDLRVNVALRDITEQFKKSIKGHREYKPAPRKMMVQRQESEEVSCDICPGNDIIAVKSCLVCQASYCTIHLRPHLRDPPLMKHGLTDPAFFVTSHLCKSHNMILDTFCKRDQTPICVKCREMDHWSHEIVPIEKESKRVRTQMKKMEAEFNQMFQARSRKLEEINISAELRKKNKELQIQTSIQVVTGVISAIERDHSFIVEEIEQKHEAAERMEEEFIKDLVREINEVRKRRSELKHLENTEDPLHLLQSFPSLSAPLAAKDWSQVRVYSDNIGTLRRSFTKLMDVCHVLEKNLSAEEMSKASQYAVDVTLDPVTASGWLCLSADGKQVSVSSQQKKPPPPDDPRRFDSCVSVLGKRSFTSGRRYWVVQVGDKSDWDLGVARESINRKGAITVRPDAGYWAICLRKGIEFKACAGPSVALHLQEKPQKVAVFLDYEEGSVSFYNADAKTHIYTFTGCLFTEPLYPYLNPCLHDNGKNTAPLTICPVEVGTPGEINLAF